MATKRTPLDAAYTSAGSPPACATATPTRRLTPDAIEARLDAAQARILRDYAPLFDALAKT